MPDNTCRATDCERNVDIKIHGFCNKHYLRFKRHGDPDYVAPPNLCSRDDCDRGAYTRSFGDSGDALCQKHYQQAKKLEADPCSIDGCDKPQFAKTWCNAHYSRDRTHGDVNAKVGRSGGGQTLREGFEHYMGSTPPEDGCWDWTGGKLQKGYGMYKVDQKPWQAHRASYILFHGEIPDGLIVRHDCDRPICVQPKHLQLGTHQDNSDDAVKRGRRPVGEAAKQSSLTEADVRNIRRRYAEGGIMYKELAAVYGIAPGNISAIVKRKTWKHVE